MQGYSTTGNTTPVPAAAASRRNAVLPALAAAFLGLLVVWGVGFSHIEALHNGAHDTRHSNAFPCH
jgi:cobalt transporter subunit CbtB